MEPFTNSRLMHVSNACGTIHGEGQQCGRDETIEACMRGQQYLGMSKLADNAILEPEGVIGMSWLKARPTHGARLGCNFGGKPPHTKRWNLFGILVRGRAKIATDGSQQHFQGVTDGQKSVTMWQIFFMDTRTCCFRSRDSAQRFSVIGIKRRLDGSMPSFEWTSPEPGRPFWPFSTVQ